MTPNRRAKLFAMESCQATSENEKEICRKLLKEAPCEVCGGFLFYRKSGKCQLCAVRKKTQKGNGFYDEAGSIDEDLWNDLKGYTYAPRTSCSECGRVLGSGMMGSSGKCLRCLFKRYTYTPRPNPPEGRPSRIKCKGCLNEIENYQIGCTVCDAEARQKAQAAASHSCLDCGKPVSLVEAVCGDCAQLHRQGLRWPPWQEAVVDEGEDNEAGDHSGNPEDPWQKKTAEEIMADRVRAAKKIADATNRAFLNALFGINL